MCGGGGGPSGETKYNWNDTLAPKWGQLLGDATAKAYGNQYQQYDGQRIADFSPLQSRAIDQIWNMTQAGGTPAAIAANNQAQGTLQDDYLTGSKANPYAGMNSPYFQQTMQQGVGDIVQGYKQGTAADTTRMFNLSGAFGGSAHQNAMANNEAMLGRTLNAYTSGMQNDQYNRSGGMYEAERGRQMGALGAGQNANNMFFQGTQQLMGAGDAQRSMNQDQLNMTYQDWLNKQNIDFKNADWLSGLYSRAQGGMSANSQTQSAGYQASPFGQLLGSYMAYKGLS